MAHTALPVRSLRPEIQGATDAPPDNNPYRLPANEQSRVERGVDWPHDKTSIREALKMSAQAFEAHRYFDRLVQGDARAFDLWPLLEFFRCEVEALPRIDQPTGLGTSWRPVAP